MYSELKINKPKHVLLVVRWPGGGIRTFLRYVYKEIDPKEWDFTILAPESQGMELLKTDLAELNPKFIPVKGMPVDGSSGAKLFTRCIIKEISSLDYSLVHSHGFISGSCAAIPSRILRLPHLMTSHDVLHDKQFKGIEGKLKKFSMRQAFRLIDMIHHVSQDAHSNFSSFFKLPTQKSIVIPNGIEVERFLGASARDFRRELDIDDNVFLIGFLGRFMSQKGFKYLIEAIDILKESNPPRKPLVLTFGEGCFQGRERKTIKERGLDKEFHMLPFTPNVAGAIKGLDVVAMPSLWEACGLVAMETLVCGTPLIGTNCIGLREVLRETPAVIVPKASSQELAKAILEEMKVSRKGRCESFKSEAEQRFCASKTRSAILKIYDELTQRD